MKNKNRYFICGLMSLFVAPFNIAADMPVKEELRWFEVEIILFKETSEKGLSNESWAKDSKLQLPENLIDFLQPKSEAILISNNNESLKQQTGIETDVEPGSGSEQAYILLNDQFLQLKAEALNISRNARYTLLNHFSWRQPVLNKKNATNIRIAGGHDYHELFDYSGEKKLEILTPIDDDINLTSSSELGSEGASNLELQSPTDSSIEDKLNPQIKPTTVDEQSLIPVALPWVPEIDGSIAIYIHRNYLHVDANLVYRKPNKEQIDIFDLANQLPNLDEPTQIITSLDHQEPAKALDANHFAWQYDRDFLSVETEKVYTERLFNYPLEQTRRLRSTELHYFDHPLIGMLVIIRPYEIVSAEEINHSIDINQQ